MRRRKEDLVMAATLAAFLVFVLIEVLAGCKELENVGKNAGQNTGKAAAHEVREAAKEVGADATRNIEDTVIAILESPLWAALAGLLLALVGVLRRHKMAAFKGIEILQRAIQQHEAGHEIVEAVKPQMRMNPLAKKLADGVMHRAGTKFKG